MNDTPILGTQVRIEDRPTVIGLPSRMFVEYFGVLSSGPEFVIFRPRDNWEYKDFQCLMRAQGMPHFIPVQILKTTRYRDGGTTDIVIEAGTFHFPSPFQAEGKPTFNGEEIMVHNRSQETAQLL